MSLPSVYNPKVKEKTVYRFFERKMKTQYIIFPNNMFLTFDLNLVTWNFNNEKRYKSYLHIVEFKASSAKKIKLCASISPEVNHCESLSNCCNTPKNIFCRFRLTHVKWLFHILDQLNEDNYENIKAVHYYNIKSNRDEIQLIYKEADDQRKKYNMIFWDKGNKVLNLITSYRITNENTERLFERRRNDMRNTIII